jgi:hypothetical protein
LAFVLNWTLTCLQCEKIYDINKIKINISTTQRRRDLLLLNQIDEKKKNFSFSCVICENSKLIYELIISMKLKFFHLNSFNLLLAFFHSSIWCETCNLHINKNQPYNFMFSSRNSKQILHVYNFIVSFTNHKKLTFQKFFSETPTNNEADKRLREREEIWKLFKNREKNFSRDLKEWS